MAHADQRVASGASLNGAADTRAQLWKYVGHLKTKCHFHKIAVRYLPLRPGKEPSQDSRRDIDAIADFQVKTFEEHILPWLKASSCDVAIPAEMRENLSHYKDLIGFLIKKDKDQKMQNEIIEILREEDKDNKLPAFTHVLALQESVGKLILCYKMLIRAKLLCNIHNILRNEGADAELFSAVNHMTALNSLSDPQRELYTANFCAVGIRINVATIAIMGVDFENREGLRVWIGDRGKEEKRDDAFARFIEKREGALLPYIGGTTSWYHCVPRMEECDKLKDQSERLARDLREYWKTMTQVTEGF